MSASGREVAHRLFAAEYDDATHSFSESDEERAPNYVVTPTGARVNRVFFVGVLTEVESVSDDVLRARVVDPTGAFVVYAGQYQPDEMAFLEDADPPTFVAVTGKARTFSPDDSDRVFTSVRPESVNEVDAETRDRWTVQAAEATLVRAATARAAMDLDLAGDALADALRQNGVPEFLADGIPRAFDVYGTTEHYLAAVADLAVDALEQVAGEADEVPGLTVAPGDAGDGTIDLDSLSALEGVVVDLERPESVDESAAASPADTGADAPSPDDEDGEQGATATAETGATGTDESPDAADGPVDADEDDDIGDFGAPSADVDEGTEAADDIGDFEPGGDSGHAADDAAAEDDRTPDDDRADDDDEAATPEPSTDDAAGEDMPAEDVLDDEERERLEEEYGTFETGTEVGEPGEADIEPEAGPIDPEEVADATGASETGERTASDGTPAGGDDDDPAETDAESDSEPAEEEPPAEDTSEVDGEPESHAEQADDEDDGPEAEDAADSDADAADVEAAVMEWMDELDDGDGADREQLVAAVVDELGVDPGAVEDAIQDALMAGKCYEPDDAHVKSI